MQLFCESTLLRRSLSSSKDAMLVPTLPEWQMQLPPMVICVQLVGLSVSGRTSHTTMAWHISFLLCNGMSL